MVTSITSRYLRTLHKYSTTNRSLKKKASVKHRGKRHTECPTRVYRFTSLAAMVASASIIVVGWSVPLGCYLARSS